jgi:hypothetical protein
MKLVKNINVKRAVTWLVASAMHRGSAKQWLTREFPKQWHACRQRSLRARTLFVVFVDADKDTVEHIEQRLWSGARAAGYADPGEGGDDPTVLLIPRWHVETWIRVLLGQSVSEDVPCNHRWKPSEDELRQAASAAYEWARENATPGPTCVDSLRRALPEWRKIG